MEADFSDPEAVAAFMKLADAPELSRSSFPCMSKSDESQLSGFDVTGDVTGGEGAVFFTLFLILGGGGL